MNVENICLKPNELMVIMPSSEKGKFYVRNFGSPATFPGESFNAATKVFSLTEDYEVMTPKILKEKVSHILESHEDVADVLGEGKIHALMYGPNNSRGKKFIRFYEVLDKELLNNWVGRIRPAVY